MDLVGDSDAVNKYKQEIRQIFNKVDVDGSGIVEKDEFIEAVKSNKAVRALMSKSRILSGLVATGDFEKAFSSFDTDGGGSVSFEEFWAFCKQEADEEQIRAMFNLIDADGSRYITHQEMVDAFSSNTKLLELVKSSKVFKNLIEQNDWKKVIEEMDTDKSGDGNEKIDYMEFWKFCQRVSARVRVQTLKQKAKERANRIAEEKKVLNDDLVKRLRVHVFRNGASQGGVFTASITSDLMNYPHLTETSNPYAPEKQKDQTPASDSVHSRQTAAAKVLAKNLRGMTFVRIGDSVF